MALIDGKTYEEHEAEINALSVKDLYKEIFPMYYGGQTYENLRHQLNPEDFYASFRAFQRIDGDKVYAEKEPYSVILDAVASYKSMALSELADEFGKAELIEDIRDRVSALENWYKDVIDVTTYPAPKSKAELLDFIAESKDLSYLDDLEAAEELHKQDVSFKRKVKKQYMDMELGRKILAVINQLNEENGATNQQIVDILVNPDYNDIKTLLEAGYINIAKQYFNNLDFESMPPMNSGYRAIIVNFINKELGS